MGVNLSQPWQTWEITHVDDGGQGAQLGIKHGWKVKNVDGKQINAENYSDIKKQLASGAKSKIKFLLPVILHHTFQSHNI